MKNNPSPLKSKKKKTRKKGAPDVNENESNFYQLKEHNPVC